MSMNKIIAPRLLTASAALPLFCLGACSYDYAALTAHVRDRATGQPVAEAQIKVTNTKTINPFPPEPGEAVTDETGSARMKAAMYNDLRVRVSAPNRAVHIFTAEHPAAIGETGWLAPTYTNPAGPASLQLRLTPGAPPDSITDDSSSNNDQSSSE